MPDHNSKARQQDAGLSLGIAMSALAEISVGRGTLEQGGDRNLAGQLEVEGFAARIEITPQRTTLTGLGDPLVVYHRGSAQALYELGAEIADQGRPERVQKIYDGLLPSVTGIVLPPIFADLALPQREPVTASSEQVCLFQLPKEYENDRLELNEALRRVSDAISEADAYSLTSALTIVQERYQKMLDREKASGSRWGGYYLTTMGGARSRDRDDNDICKASMYTLRREARTQLTEICLSEYRSQPAHVQLRDKILDCLVDMRVSESENGEILENSILHQMVLTEVSHRAAVKHIEFMDPKYSSSKGGSQEEDRLHRLALYGPMVDIANVVFSPERVSGLVLRAKLKDESLMLDEVLQRAPHAQEYAKDMQAKYLREADRKFVENICGKDALPLQFITRTWRNLAVECIEDLRSRSPYFRLPSSLIETDRNLVASFRAAVESMEHSIMPELKLHIGSF